MADYLIHGGTLTGIADAIREKLGTETAMSPESMPAYIRGITLSAPDTEDIPEDIYAEAVRVAGNMEPKIGANAVTFLAMADMHRPGDGELANETVAETYRESNRSAGQGAKLIAERIGLDFFANLGDFAFGSSATSVAAGTQAILDARLDTAGVMEGMVCFCTPGNHDPLTYSCGMNGQYLSPEVLTGLIGSYGYLDLEEKKVRVICLNTADNAGITVKENGGTERISGAQLQWFAESLDLSGKTDAAQWKILLLSHHPLDWGAIQVAGNCLAAYLEGGTYGVTHEGTAVYYDFAGKNSAGVIAQFHGHTHCFKVDYIHDFRSGSPVATTVQRLAIPNACYYRNNEYGTTQTYGLVFGEDTTYGKSNNGTGKNTAFCLVSIDLDENMIYADCFGAGYDRRVSFSAEAVDTWKVTNALTNAASSNSAVSVVAGAAYRATITADSGYVLESVTVTMGGQDVTDSVYSDGVIAIDSVTGDIVITAAAAAASGGDAGDGGGESEGTSNLGQIAQAIDSTAIYNDGLGYKNGYYLSSDYPFEGTDSTTVLTGFIPYPVPPAGVPGSIYISGAKWEAVSHCRLYYFTADKSSRCGPAINGSGSSLAALDTHYTVEVLGDSEYRLTPIVNPDSSEGSWVTIGTVATVTDACYLRMSLVGTGENLVIRVEENTDTGEDGDGGGDTGSYTNQVSTSVDTDGSIFNGTGYKTGYRLNSSGAETETSGCIVSGFIPYAGQVIRVRTSGGLGLTQSGNYLAMYDSSFQILYSASFSSLTNNGAVFAEDGTDYCLLTVDPAAITNTTYQDYLAAAAYIRCSYCSVNAAADFVVTLDEPIESA